MSEDTSWVFDSLVCFLHGPIWNAPLQTFVEEKSLIFDPNEIADINNPDYVRTHEEYKNLVDLMLGSFMEEMQISPYQFEVACLEGRQSGSTNSFSFHQGLFQQIWAANDIRIFVRMMTQRNVEIQLQALDLIEHRQTGLVSDGSESTEATHLDVVVNGTEELIDQPDETPAAEEIESPDKELFSTIESVLSREKQAAASNDPEADVEETADKFKRLNLFFDKEQIDSADVQSRQEYLRAQRDKILKIKKMARARQLNESVRKNGRPSSALAAQSILNGGSGQAALMASEMAEPLEASMQLRKTLARRLRTEVVDDDRTKE